MSAGHPHHAEIDRAHPQILLQSVVPAPKRPRLLTMTASPSNVSADGDAWHEVLSEQHGVVHRSDIPPELFRHASSRVRRGLWRRLSRDVFVTHNGPLTVDQQLWAVIRAAPRHAALSGPTALALADLRGFPAHAIHVTVPCGTSMPDVAGVNIAVHYSRFLGPADVHPVLRPRRTRAARSALDAAAWEDSDARARAVLLASVQQRLLTSQLLAEALPRRGPCLRHALITETIHDAAGGIASVPEREFERIRQQWNLPNPSRQRVIRRSHGPYYLDVDWEDYALAAEIDGMPHMDILNWDADLDRMNEIAIDQRTVLRFTSFTVRHRPLSVGDTLTRALMARGWR